MGKFKKILAGVLCGITAVCSLFTGVGCGNGAAAPDYAESEKEFLYWGYSATYDGWWQTYYPENPNNRVRLENSEETPIAITDKASLQEYKDCGFNVLFINYVFQGFRSDNFNNENDKMAKRVHEIMDWCAELDLKCFLFDGVLHGLSAKDESLIDPVNANGTTKFASQEALEEYIENYVKDVVEHPAFFGYSLNDEPAYTKLTSLGEVYKALKKIAPKAFFQMNLLPISTSQQNKYCANANNMNMLDAYKEYLELYREATGASYIQYDSYPLEGDDENPRIEPEYYLNMQIVADFCKKYNMDFYHVFQSCAWRNGFVNTVGAGRKANDKADMYWQLNTGMAFGVKGYAYWNYYPCVNTNGEHHDLTSSFLNRDGSQNPMYKWMKGIHQEMQNTEKTLAYFDYQASSVFTKTPVPGLRTHITGLEKQSFDCIEKPALKSNGILLVTELYDEENEQIGYYFVNATDTLKKKDMEFTVDFKGYKKAQLYYKGSVENTKLDGNTLSYTLGPGEGVFVLPY